MAKLFDALEFWMDPIPRTGPENMAVDDWLLETTATPVLRSYTWDGAWVSLGYFGRMQDAACVMQDGEAKLVRRGTGGGIVDHRIDQTYTLAVPKTHALAAMRGAESYRVIHEALVAAMRAVGIEARLVEAAGEEESAACFEKPVEWDVVDGAGRKIAGAGQRRTRVGLLHQGSVLLLRGVEGLFEALSAELAGVVEQESREPSIEELAAGVEKFGSRDWLERR